MGWDRLLSPNYDSISVTVQTPRLAPTLGSDPTQQAIPFVLVFFLTFTGAKKLFVSTWKQYAFQCCLFGRNIPKKLNNIEECLSFKKLLNIYL